VGPFALHTAFSLLPRPRVELVGLRCVEVGGRLLQHLPRQYLVTGRVLDVDVDRVARHRDCYVHIDLHLVPLTLLHGELLLRNPVEELADLTPRQPEACGDEEQRQCTAPRRTCGVCYPCLGYGVDREGEKLATSI